MATIGSVSVLVFTAPSSCSCGALAKYENFTIKELFFRQNCEFFVGACDCYRCLLFDSTIAMKDRLTEMVSFWEIEIISKIFFLEICFDIFIDVCKKMSFILTISG